MEPKDLLQLRDPLATLADAAARVILEHYHGEIPLEAETKADDTPVTAADLAAHDVLVTGLASIGLPDDGSLPVLSEESSEQAFDQRLSWPRFWMIDPLDGTREFLARNDEFCVNIALIEDGRARLGLVAIPCTGELFFGGPELGAWRRGSDGWDRVRARCGDDDEPLRVFTSRRHGGLRLEALLKTLQSRVCGLQRLYSGSAIKFCRLAEGAADLYPRFTPCSEWDTAAGHALLQGAGGDVLGLDAVPLVYNKPDSLRSPEFYALADPGRPLWAALY